MSYELKQHLNTKLPKQFIGEILTYFGIQPSGLKWDWCQQMCTLIEKLKNGETFQSEIGIPRTLKFDDFKKFILRDVTGKRFHFTRLV
jgi:hypothetical protein